MKQFFAAAILLGLSQPAFADTTLRLSETAHIAVHPDEIAASLRFEANAGTAAEAQTRVNAAIGKAIAQAREIQGIVINTGFYNVWQMTQPTTQWRASQSFELKGGDGAAMLQLIATLQSQGLSVERLGWRLTPKTAREARSAATKIALGALKTRAEEAAGILGLRFVSFREIRLDGTRPNAQPLPMFARAAPAAMTAAAPPPQAIAEDIDVEASVDADAVLVPAQP
jgi:predicted secreted protein